MVNTLGQNLQNYWQRTGHFGYEVRRQKKPMEWIVVKPVKRESTSLTHFSTTIIYLVTYNFCPNAIYMSTTISILVEIKEMKEMTIFIH